jgi:hypothetical protein
MFAGMMARPRANLVTDKLRGYPLRGAGAEAVAAVLNQQSTVTVFLQPEVLANRDILHFRGNDALLRVVHLGDVGTGPGTPRVANVLEAKVGQLRVALALVAELRARAIQHLGVATLRDPGTTHLRQALQQVDAGIGVRVGTRGVVDGNGRVLFRAETGRRVALLDLAHGYTQIIARALHMDLAGIRERPRYLFGKLRRLLDKVFWNGTHGAPSCHCDGFNAGRCASFPTPVSPGSGSKGFSQPDRAPPAAEATR